MVGKRFVTGPWLPVTKRSHSISVKHRTNKLNSSLRFALLYYSDMAKY